MVILKSLTSISAEIIAVIIKMPHITAAYGGIFFRSELKNKLEAITISATTILILTLR